MTVRLLLIAAALVPVALPATASAHLVCSTTTAPDPNCQDDADHDCLPPPPAPQEPVIVCFSVRPH